LGTWFRDYLYIPLGGSRVSSKRRLVFNLFIVWLCTGFWHGANWTFILWGLMYFVFITLEKLTGWDRLVSKNRIISILSRCYTLFLVMIGWVLFRAESVLDALQYIGRLFYSNDGSALIASNVEVFWLRENAVFFIAAAIFSTPIAKWVYSKAEQSKPLQVAYTALMLLIFIITISYTVKSSYNPFIYFNF